MHLRWGPQRAMLEWGEEEMRSAKKSLTREETFVSEAISDDCGAKLLQKNDLKKVKCTKSEKNAINVEKNQRSCIFTIILNWHFCQLFTKFTKFTHF